jgi:hypothetical protein
MLKSTHVLDTMAERQEMYRWLSGVRTLRARFLESPDHGIFCTARMNVSSAAAHAFARRFASLSVRAEVSHLVDAAAFALLTAVVALRYAAASSGTVGVGAGVADDIGVAVASGADGGGIAPAGGVGDGAGVAVGAGVEVAAGPVAATTGGPDDWDNQPAAVTARKTTTITVTTA